MSDLFKCVKCGKQLYNKHEQEIHEKDCDGGSISMEVINRIAKEGLSALDKSVEMGFECAICGEDQMFKTLDEYRMRPLKDMCDHCKSDLKEIILTKRKGEEL